MAKQHFNPHTAHIKKIRCKDCKHCDVTNRKCHPESEDCKSEYDLTSSDINKYRDNDCDFYNMNF